MSRPGSPGKSSSTMVATCRTRSTTAVAVCGVVRHTRRMSSTWFSEAPWRARPPARGATYADLLSARSVAGSPATATHLAPANDAISKCLRSTPRRVATGAASDTSYYPNQPHGGDQGTAPERHKAQAGDQRHESDGKAHVRRGR